MLWQLKITLKCCTMCDPPIPLYVLFKIFFPHHSSLLWPKRPTSCLKFTSRRNQETALCLKDVCLNTWRLKNIRNAAHAFLHVLQTRKDLYVCVRVCDGACVCVFKCQVRRAYIFHKKSCFLFFCLSAKKKKKEKPKTKPKVSHQFHLLISTHILWQHRG